MQPYQQLTAAGLTSLPLYTYLPTIPGLTNISSLPGYANLGFLPSPSFPPFGSLVMPHPPASSLAIKSVASLPSSSAATPQTTAPVYSLVPFLPIVNDPGFASFFNSSHSLTHPIPPPRPVTFMPSPAAPPIPPDKLSPSPNYTETATPNSMYKSTGNSINFSSSKQSSDTGSDSRPSDVKVSLESTTCTVPSTLNSSNLNRKVIEISVIGDNSSGPGSLNNKPSSIRTISRGSNRNSSAHRASSQSNGRRVPLSINGNQRNSHGLFLNDVAPGMTMDLNLNPFPMRPPPLLYQPPFARPMGYRLTPVLCPLHWHSASFHCVDCNQPLCNRCLVDSPLQQRPPQAPPRHTGHSLLDAQELTIDFLGPHFGALEAQLNDQYKSASERALALTDSDEALTCNGVQQVERVTFALSGLRSKLFANTLDDTSIGVGVDALEVQLVSTTLRLLDSIRRRACIESRVQTLATHKSRVTHAGRVLKSTWASLYAPAPAAEVMAMARECDSACEPIARERQRGSTPFSSPSPSPSPLSQSPPNASSLDDANAHSHPAPEPVQSVFSAPPSHTDPYVYPMASISLLLGALQLAQRALHQCPSEFEHMSANAEFARCSSDTRVAAAPAIDQRVLVRIDDVAQWVALAASYILRMAPSSVRIVSTCEYEKQLAADSDAVLSSCTDADGESNQCASTLFPAYGRTLARDCANLTSTLQHLISTKTNSSG